VASPSTGRFTAFPTSGTGLFRVELVRSSSQVRRLATLTPRCPRLFGIELMRGTLLMRCSASCASFFRVELVRRALLVRGLSSHAGYLALFFTVHGSKATPAGTAAGTGIPITVVFFVIFLRSHDKPPQSISRQLSFTPF
jgi:hypothetical protein